VNLVGERACAVLRSTMIDYQLCPASRPTSAHFDVFVSATYSISQSIRQNSFGWQKKRHTNKRKYNAYANDTTRHDTIRYDTI